MSECEECGATIDISDGRMFSEMSHAQNAEHYKTRAERAEILVREAKDIFSQMGITHEPISREDSNRIQAWYDKLNSFSSLTPPAEPRE